MSDIDAMNVGPRWYVAHTYSGYESKVKANLEKIVENRGLGDLIFDVRIPVETVVVKENGEEKTVESKRRWPSTGSAASGTAFCRFWCGRRESTRASASTGR